MSNKALPRIPLDVFSKMIQTLPLDALRELPASKLPREIPQEILRGITGERRDILDDLLFEANSHHVQERLALEEIFGSDLIAALDQAKKDPSSAVSESLKTHIDKFANIVKQFIDTQDEYSTDAVKRGIEALSPEVKKSYQNKMDMAGYISMLSDGFHLAGEFQPEFKAALASMKAQTQVFSEWLGKYYIALLNYVDFHLDQTAKDIDSRQKKMQLVTWEINEIKKRIVSSTEAMGLSSVQANHNHFIQELKQDLQLMEASKAELDIMLPEAKLTNWLDCIVDAFLCPVESEALEDTLKATRDSLSVLLASYCKLQLKAAEQIAEQEFSVLDKDQNIKYMLETERFVSRYFKEKDFDVKSWGASSGNVERLQAFEQEVLAEIQQHSLN